VKLSPAYCGVPHSLSRKGPSAGPSIPEEGLETHGRTPRGLGVRPCGRRELRRIKVAPKVQRARNPAGPLLSVPSTGLLLDFVQGQAQVGLN